MLKELLLQFFLSLVPIFSFQLWHDKERGWNGFKLFIVVFCGIAMLLCTLTSPHFFNYDLSFRFVPYILGSLYGGYWALAGLTVLNVITRIPTLDSASETVSFALLTLFSVILLLISIRSFQRASPVRKIRKGIMLMSLMALLIIILFNNYLVVNDLAWSISLAGEFVVSVAALLMATWYSFYRVENIRRKQRLYDKIKHLSTSYQNEVVKLQQFIETVPIAVLIVDSEGRISQINEMAMKQLQLRPKYPNPGTLLGVPVETVFQSNEGEVYVNMIIQALNGKTDSLVPVLEAEQMLLYTSVSLRDLSENRISGAALIAQDITEITRLRDEVGRMERLSLVGQMAASITHEIRNPMAVIRGFIQLIQEKSSQSHFEYFRIIMEELDRTNLIISDFLSLAQNRELKMETTSLHTIINEMIPLLNADANMRGQTVEVELCEDLPLLPLNQREIKQMLLNIARNGMEAMQEKGVLRIKTSFNETHVFMMISDEGVGIPPDKRQHLFEPFFTTKTRGTGLGLPLCLSIAERHNGGIDVESNEGQGTVFIVKFGLKPNLI